MHKFSLKKVETIFKIQEDEFDGVEGNILRVKDAEKIKNLPKFMVLISIVQFSFCLYHMIEFSDGEGGWKNDCSRLLLIPQRRWQNPWYVN